MAGKITMRRRLMSMLAPWQRCHWCGRRGHDFPSLRCPDHYATTGPWRLFHKALG
jgi:hypothetical protein